jgi:hypothetical protein
MLRELRLEDALHVTRSMRDIDRVCIQALTGGITDESFAMDRFNSDGPAWTVLGSDGRPVACTGLTFQTAWTGVVWLLATPGIGVHSWANVMRLARRVLRNATDPANSHYRHRVEAHTLAGWAGAADLAKRLGFVHEGTRRAAGAGGEDMHVWAMYGPAKGAK